MKVFKGSREQGFSLVELMVVVGIIGILATLAMPRFKQFQAKAKMSEAKTMLGHIYSLEQAYYLDQNEYAAIGAHGADTTKVKGCADPADPIGFSVEPCGTNSPVPRYSYTVTTPTTVTFVASGITGTGANNRICPGNTPHYYVTNEKNDMGSAFGNTVAAQTNEAGVGTLCPD